jgi:hypothetical protein
MAVDPQRRAALAAHCGRFAATHDGALPAVTIEQFFDGNDDLGSIMCNLNPESTEQVRAILEGIRSRPEVESVLVQVHEVVDGFDDTWPFAEQVLITTSAGAANVRAWFPRDLAPDEVTLLDEPLPGVPPPRARGAATWVAWWD